ncbi:putative secreted protein [Bradyrhizobium diazoefficiens]
MPQKKNPAAVATAAGAQGIAVSKNTATIAQTGGKANGPAFTSIRRGPGGKAEWLVSIEGVVCTDVPVSDQRLRRSKRFCNVLRHRCGVNFDPIPQAAWSAIVEAAIAKVGAA